MVQLLGYDGVVSSAAILAFFAKVVSGMQWDLEAQLGFYGAYHQDPRNQLIHFFFVPSILCATMLMLAHFSIFGLRLPVPGTGGHSLNGGSVVVAIYATYYLQLAPLGGGIFVGCLLLPMYALSTYLVRCDRQAAAAKRGASAKPSGAGGLGFAMKLSLAVQVVAWYMQIHPGHAIFERVKPALLDSLGQSLTVAPLFAFYEGVFFMGLEQGLQERTLAAVASHRAGMCAENPAFAFCDAL